MIVRKVQVENWGVFRSPFEADFAISKGNSKKRGRGEANWQG